MWNTHLPGRSIAICIPDEVILTAGAAPSREFNLSGIAHTVGSDRKRGTRGNAGWKCCPATGRGRSDSNLYAAGGTAISPAGRKFKRTTTAFQPGTVVIGVANYPVGARGSKLGGARTIA